MNHRRYLLNNHDKNIYLFDEIDKTLIDSNINNCVDKVNEEKYKDLPYEVRGVHHSIIGDLDGFAVVSYKGSPKVLWKGKRIDQIDYDDIDDTDYDNYNKETYEFGKKENTE